MTREKTMTRDYQITAVTRLRKKGKCNSVFGNLMSLSLVLGLLLSWCMFIFFAQRVGESRRRHMHLVPAPAVRLMKRRVQSRPGLRQENRPGRNGLAVSFLESLTLGIYLTTITLRQPVCNRLLIYLRLHGGCHKVGRKVLDSSF